MPEINDIDLKLNIIASDEATSVLKDLSAVTDTVKEALDGLSGLNPFADLKDGADSAITSLNELKTTMTGVLDVFESLYSNPFAYLSSSIAGTLDQLSEFDGYLNTARTSLSSFQQELQTANAEGFQALDESAQEAEGKIGQMQTAATDLNSVLGEVSFDSWMPSLTSVQEELSKIVSEFQEIALLAREGLGGSGGGGKASTVASTAEINSWFKNLNDQTGAMTPEELQAYQDAMKNASGPANQVPSAVRDFYNQYGMGLMAPGFSEDLGMGPGGTGTKAMPSWLSATSEASSMLNELPMKLMYGGMNAMMGYYGMQSLATSTTNFQAIAGMRSLNNMTPNEAAQAYAMLGSAGMTGGSGVSFLRGLAGNMQQLFTPAAGSGAMSQNALLLESLGITRQDTAQSPFQLLQTIAQRYQTLLSQGRGNQASELLNLTGTSQVAPLMSDWSGMQKQASSINLGMSTKQLDQASNQSMTLEMDMQKLSLAFSELALTLTPLVEKIAKTLGDLATDFSTGKGPFDDLKSAVNTVVTDMGKLPAAILAFIAAMKTASFVGDVLSGAGVLGEAGGGLTLGKLVGKGGKGVASLIKRLTGAGAEAETGAAADIAEGSAAASGAADATGVGIPVGLGILGIGGITAAAVAGMQRFLNHMQTIHTMSENAGQALNQWSDDTQNWIGQTTSEIATWVSSTGSSIGQWVATHTQDIIGWARQTGQSIASWSQTTVKSFSQWSNDLGKWAGSLWTDVSKNFTDWTQNLGQWASGLWGSSAKDFSSFTSQLGQWASQLWNNTSSDFGNFVRGVGTWAGQLWNNTSEYFGNFVRGLSSWAGQLWNDSSKDFGNFVNGLGKWATGLWGSVESDFTSFTSSLSNWASGLWDSVKNFFGFGGGGSSAPTSASVPSSAGVNQWTSDVNAAAAKYKVPASVIKAIMMNEDASGNPSAGSLGGAYGLMQLEPGTAGATNADRANPASNIMYGTKYLSELYSQYHNWSTVAEAYYGGSGNLAAHGANSVPDPGAGNTKTLAQYAQSFENNLTSLGQSVATTAKNIASTATSVFHSIFGGGSSSSSSSSYVPTGGAGGKALRVPALATGGLVSSPTLALVGEAGPEMVLPLNDYPVSPGAIHSLPRGGGVGGSGGGTMTINININGPQLTDRATARNLARIVANEFTQNIKMRGNFDLG